MVDVPLLGQGKKPEPKAAQQGNEPAGVTTAFMAYMDTEGQWVITPDINTSIIPAREPTPDEMYACACIVQKDFSAQAAAQATVTLQMMQAQAIANQQANMAMQQKLAQGK
jgi:hypothetical protein